MWTRSFGLSTSSTVIIGHRQKSRTAIKSSQCVSVRRCKQLQLLCSFCKKCVHCDKRCLWRKTYGWNNNHGRNLERIRSKHSTKTIKEWIGSRKGHVLAKVVWQSYHCCGRSSSDSPYAAHFSLLTNLISLVTAHSNATHFSILTGLHFLLLILNSSLYTAYLFTVFHCSFLTM